VLRGIGCFGSGPLRFHVRLAVSLGGLQDAIDGAAAKVFTVIAQRIDGLLRFAVLSRIVAGPGEHREGGFGRGIGVSRVCAALAFLSCRHGLEPPSMSWRICSITHF